MDEVDKKIEEALKDQGDIEIRNLYLERGEIFKEISDIDWERECYEKALEKTASI